MVSIFRVGNFPVPWTARTSEKVTSDWQAKQYTLLAMDTTLLLFNLLTFLCRGTSV